AADGDLGAPAPQCRTRCGSQSRGRDHGRVRAEGLNAAKPCAGPAQSACGALPALATLDRVASDDLAEQAVFLVEQRELAVLELPEELVPGDLDELVVLG